MMNLMCDQMKVYKKEWHIKVMGSAIYSTYFQMPKYHHVGTSTYVLNQFNANPQKWMQSFLPQN